jgi:hypothetical protein
MALNPKLYEEVRKIFIAYLENQSLRKTPERYAILEEIYSAAPQSIIPLTCWYSVTLSPGINLVKTRPSTRNPMAPGSMIT